MKPTHHDLVLRACRWLDKSRRCGLVTAEPVACSEQPDAIGWCGMFSTVVECKTSRADLLRERKKWHRRFYKGLGRTRWFMMPLDLAEACGDVIAAHYQGWGVLGVYQGVRCVKVLAEPSERWPERDTDTLRHELAIAVDIARKATDPRYRYDAAAYRYIWLGESAP